MTGYFLDRSAAALAGSGNFSLSASNSISLFAGATAAVTVTGANMWTVGGMHNLAVAGTVFESAGLDSREVVGGTKIIDAHSAIHLRSGKSEIIMNCDGTITIKGTNLLIEESETMKVTAQTVDITP